METNDLEQISQVLNEFYRNVTLFSQDLMESLKVRNICHPLKSYLPIY